MLVTINPAAGINKERTKLQNVGAWIDGDKVRFEQGSPQSIGGWTDSSAGVTFAGICRGLHVWQKLDSSIDVAIGTQLRLYIWEGGTFYDVTPIDHTVTLTNPFTTTQGSSIITVADSSSFPSTGDVININGSVSIGGLTLSGAYQVTVSSVVQGIYTIDAGTIAMSSVVGGDTVVIDYYIQAGSLSGGGTGFGSGTYGQGTYGTPRVPIVVSGVQPPTAQNPSTWSLDDFGENLIANRRGGKIFQWVATNGFTVRAVPLPASVTDTNGNESATGAPQLAECVLVSTPDRHLVAFGAESGGVQDLMSVRWSDQENFLLAGSWAATDINSAGGQRLQGGTRILNAVKVGSQILIHTDTDLISMRFIGAPYIFGFTPVGSRCGLIAAKATVEFNGLLFWMGDHDFFMYDGIIHVLPCTVRRFVFDGINRNAVGKVHTSICRDFSEIWFFYPDGTNTECNRYVIFSIIEQTWSIGSMDRTCYNDGGAVGTPLATDSQGILYYQESGTTANGTPMLSYIESGDYEYGQGDSLIYIDRLIPDITQDDAGEVDITLTLRKYPSDVNGYQTGDVPASGMTPNTGAVKGPFTITTTTPKVSFRARARQIAFKLSSFTKWRLGSPRLRIQEDGKR